MYSQSQPAIAQLIDHIRHQTNFINGELVHERMVLADVLMEQGNHQGELMALTDRLITVSSQDPLYPTLVQEIDRSSAKIRAELTELFSVPEDDWTIENGVVTGLRLSLRRYPDTTRLFQQISSHRVMNALPFLNQLELRHTKSEDLETLLASALFRQILHLSIHLKTHSLVQLFFAHPALAALESLTLMGNPVHCAGARALANSSQLTQLNSLDLSFNRIGNKGLQALANAAWNGNLKQLFLAGNYFQSSAFDELRNANCWENLRQLDLRFNKLDDDAARVLADSNWMRSVEILNLSDNQITSDGLESLLHSHNLQQLKHLNLQGNQLNESGLLALSESELLEHIDCLNVADNRCGFKAVRALVSSPHLKSKATINLANNQLGEEQLQKLQSLATPKQVCLLN
jgi:hypothetical protein